MSEQTITEPDDFTMNHLSEWVTMNVYPEDATPFIDYVLAEYQDDPEWVTGAGWPTLYRRFELVDMESQIR